MTSASKSKGSAWERDCVRYLNSWTFAAHADRMPAGATHDRGDIGGIPHLVIECKNHANVGDAVRLGVDGLVDKSDAAKADHAVAFVKRRGKPAAEGYAVVTITAWCQLYDQLIDAERRVVAKDQALRAAVSLLADERNQGE